MLGGFVGGLKWPSCESCERWLEETKDAVRVAAGDAGELKLRLEAKDMGFLEKQAQRLRALGQGFASPGTP